MTATSHALVGGAIAASIHNPILGISLAAFSHPVLDAIPHWDFGWGWKKKSKFKLLVESSFDLLLGLALSYLLFGQNVPTWYFFTAVLASEVWDILEAPYWFFNWRFPPFNLIYNLQSSIQGKTKTVFSGLLVQVGVVLGIVALLKAFS